MAKKSLVSKKKTFLIEDKYIKYILLALISVFMIIIPFYRGLFFRENYMPAIAFISLLYFAYLVYKLLHKDYRIIDTYLDLAVLAIPICYFISFLFGVNAKDGLDAVLVYASYFMIYRIASEITKNDEKKKNILLNLIIASTFITAFTSILTLSGFLSLNGVIVGNRIYGLYQYSNTTASVFAMGIVLTLNALIASGDIKVKLLYQAILTTLLAALIFTLSKGGLLSLLIILLINFLILSAKPKVSFISNILIAALSDFLFIYKFYNEVSPETVNIMPDYLTSIAICFALTFILHFLGKKLFQNINEKKTNIALIALLLIFASIGTFIFLAREPIEYKVEHLAGEAKSWKYTAIYINDIEKDTGHALEFKVKSSLENQYSYGVIIRSFNEKNEIEEIYREFNSVGGDFENVKIEFSTLEDTDKLLFLLYNYETDSYTVYKDVVLKDSFGNIIKKQERFKYIPDAIANRFKNFDLKSTSVFSRNQFMKDGIKIFKDHPLTGAGGGGWNNLYKQYQPYPYSTTEVHNFYIQYAIETGILGIAALFMALIHLAIGFIKGVRASSSYLPVYYAVMLLLGHSFIDFNLSLPAVAFILWMLIGIIDSDDNIKKTSLRQNKITCWGLLILSILVSVTSTSIYYGVNLGIKASKIVNKDTDAAMPLYEKAMKFDRFNAAYRIDYAQIMSNRFASSQDAEAYKSILEQISKANKYEPYNSLYTQTVVNLMLSNGLLDEAVSLADAKVQKEPMMFQWYIQKIEVNYEIAKYYFSNKEHGKAIPYLENMVKAKEEYEAANEKALQPMKLPKDYNMKTDLALNWIEQAERLESKKR